MKLPEFPSTQTVFSIPFFGISSLENYAQLDKLGEGTFGTVTKCVLKNNKRQKLLVALKKINLHDTKSGFPITAFREITILKQLRHKNILPLLDVVAQKDNKISNISGLGGINHTYCSFFLVSPYMSSDLSGLLHNPDIVFDERIIKCFLIQLLEGLNYLHHQRYYHRDIKAANLLVDGNGCLKIADFGLARKYYGFPPNPQGGPSQVRAQYTALVVTRWYRAPELLLGDSFYTTSIDMWGAGCIFGELFEHSPILKGKTDLDQLYRIFDLCGEPNPRSYPGYEKLKNPMNAVITMRRPTLYDRFGGYFETQLSKKHGLDLLGKLLHLNPMTRFNAEQCLHHPYFSTAPFPYKPHELPQFRPSHEIDNKRFNEERERRKMSRGKHGDRGGFDRPGDGQIHSFFKSGLPTGPRSMNGSKGRPWSGSNDHSRREPGSKIDGKYDHLRRKDSGRWGDNGRRGMSPRRPENGANQSNGSDKIFLSRSSIKKRRKRERKAAEKAAAERTETETAAGLKRPPDDMSENRKRRDRKEPPLLSPDKANSSFGSFGSSQTVMLSASSATVSGSLLSNKFSSEEVRSQFDEATNKESCFANKGMDQSNKSDSNDSHKKQILVAKEGSKAPGFENQDSVMKDASDPKR